MKVDNRSNEPRGFTEDFAREFVLPQIEYWLTHVYKLPEVFSDDIEREHYEAMKTVVNNLRDGFSPPYHEDYRFPFHEVVISQGQVEALEGLFGDNYTHLKQRIKRKQTAGSAFLSVADEEELVNKMELFLTQVAPTLKGALERRFFEDFTPGPELTQTTDSSAKMFDVFVCHASEDKDFAGGLASELRSSGVKVWYDDFIMDWGGSIRESIDAGLRESRFGIVIFSRAFLKKKKWTEYELSGLVSRESAGTNIILPILHEIALDEFAGYSASLADRIAKDSKKDSISDIVSGVLSLLER